MSNEGSASQSESSNSSSSQLSFFNDNVIDLTIFGNAAPGFIRTGTVVRRATLPFRKDRMESTSSTEDDDVAPNEKLHRDHQYRHSLAAITERRSARNSISNESGKSMHIRTYNSMDTSSDGAEYAPRSFPSDYHRLEKSATSPTSSSYLSWIESVNSEYFGSAVSNDTAEEIDGKVGEWNNFWLNYSNSKLHQLSRERTFSSDCADRSVDGQSEERKSATSTQKDVTDKSSLDCIMLTVEELQETLRCSQRITEILQNAMRRSEVDECSNQSYYSQQESGKDSANDDMPLGVTSRERSVSCVDQLSTQRQKQVLKQNEQSSSTSCINAILHTGVADILKRVISKRRDVNNSENGTKTRSSFSEWTHF